MPTPHASLQRDFEKCRRRSMYQISTLVAVLAAALLWGCGPSTEAVKWGWWRALQVELDATQTQWLADTRRHQYPSYASAMRGLQTRYAEVYQRWHVEMDPVSQGVLAYLIALWTRVDQRELSWDDAQRVQERFDSDVAEARPRLPALDDSPTAQTDLIQWWTSNWEQHRTIYEAVPSHPIRCITTPVSEIVCE
jgi:hypothetical protein